MRTMSQKTGPATPQASSVKSSTISRAADGAMAKERHVATGESASRRRVSDPGRIPVSPARTGPLHTTLAISTPGDAFEREADRVAEQLRIPEWRSQRPEPPEAERALARVNRTHVNGAELNLAPPTVRETIAACGQPLDAVARAFFEPRFGYDLGHVRVHTDAKAEESARDINARAYTLGPHIVFAQGQYKPGSSEGRHLLAHELTHVVQQGQGHTFLIQRQVGDDLRQERIGQARLENLLILYIDSYVARQETPFYEPRSGILGERRAYPRSFLSRARTREYILNEFEGGIQWLAERGRWPDIDWVINRFPETHIARVPAAPMARLREIAARVTGAIDVGDHTGWDEVRRVPVTTGERSVWEARVDSAFRTDGPGAKIELINEALLPDQSRFPELHFPVQIADSAQFRAGGLYYENDLPGRSGEALLGYRPASGRAETSFDSGNPPLTEQALVARAIGDNRVEALFSFIVLGPGSLSRGSQAWTASIVFHEYQHYQDFVQAIGRGGAAIRAHVNRVPVAANSRHGRIRVATLRAYFGSYERWRGSSSGRGSAPFPSYTVAGSLESADLYTERLYELTNIHAEFEGYDGLTQQFVIDQITELAAIDPEVRRELRMLTNNLPDEVRTGVPSTLKVRLLRVL